MRWGGASGLAAVAFVLTALGGIVLTFLYGWAVSIETGLCGKTPAAAIAVGCVAYAVLAAWASLSPKRVWAWLFVTGAALAAVTLVSYFFADAHHYCET